MKQKNTVQYAYLAGVIDSDGCIAIKRSSNQGKSEKTGHNRIPSYSLTINVNQIDGGSIDFMYGAFGGNVYKNQQYGHGTMNIYRWELKQDKAAYVLKRLIPFLRNKKKQAEAGVRFIEIYRKQNPNPNGRSGRYPVTAKQLEIREKLYQELRKLKQYHKPSAAVETKCDDSSIDEKR